MGYRFQKGFRDGIQAILGLPENISAFSSNVGQCRH
jgi:hypothetical protein